MMSTTHMVLFRRPTEESPDIFGKRLRSLAADIAADERAEDLVVLVSDGEVGAPPEASAYAATIDGALLVTGVPATELPAGDVVCRMRRRVIKARPRGSDGERSEGFTVICPSVRASFLTHDQFDAHWRDNHSKVHVASSPGTCHYEQLIIDEVLSPEQPIWDGIGLLSFESAPDYTERLFSGPDGQKAIMDDTDRFLDLTKGETLPASEFVYRDSQA
jgi:EthD domain